MKKINIGKHVVKLYDSIEELPVVRYHKYTKMLLVDSGVGSDIADFDNHIERVVRYINSKKFYEASGELENLRQNVYFMQNEIDCRTFAFASLVVEIDGVACTDISDEGLKRVIEKLNDVPVGQFLKTLQESKKKIEDELQEYFPKYFDDPVIKQYYETLRDRTIILLEQLQNGKTEKTEKDLESLTDNLVLWNKPQKFGGPDSVEIQHDKGFERMCLVLSQNFNQNPKSMTVMEFYQAFEYLEELERKNKRK